ncbi:hypothetical protein FNF28_01323 [Cafeteria roenbergensis]|uniref:VLRF1 domain-containing protein n=1 Tax=Cafeteria roenbergensis TaxID=33653 RepID=A0A5A8E3T4_CAFRO|nr:hypothetical protein FNF28_01323 [Cafeteria roenbergensis]
MEARAHAGAASEASAVAADAAGDAAAAAAAAAAESGLRVPLAAMDLLARRRCLAHTTHSAYTVRRKQGGAQSSRDSGGGGRPRSMGAKLRREGERKLRRSIAATFAGWEPLVRRCCRVFIGCASSTEGELMTAETADADSSVLQAAQAASRATAEAAGVPAPARPFGLRRSDDRIRRIPFATGKPGFAEACASFTKLLACEDAGEWDAHLSVVAEAVLARGPGDGGAGDGGRAMAGPRAAPESSARGAPGAAPESSMGRAPSSATEASDSGMDRVAQESRGFARLGSHQSESSDDEDGASGASGADDDEDAALAPAADEGAGAAEKEARAERERQRRRAKRARRRDNARAAKSRAAAAEAGTAGAPAVAETADSAEPTPAASKESMLSLAPADVVAKARVAVLRARTEVDAVAASLAGTLRVPQHILASAIEARGGGEASTVIGPAEVRSRCQLATDMVAAGLEAGQLLEILGWSDAAAVAVAAADDPSAWASLRFTARGDAEEAAVAAAAPASVPGASSAEASVEAGGEQEDADSALGACVCA